MGLAATLCALRVNIPDARLPLTSYRRLLDLSEQLVVASWCRAFNIHNILEILLLPEGPLLGLV